MALFIQPQAVNPGMKMPGLDSGLASGDASSSSRGIATYSGQRQLDQVALQDFSLMSLGSGQLNKDEFISLSAEQNDLAQMSGGFAADGYIDERERGQLNSRRSQFQEHLAQYRNGDFHPSRPSNVRDRQSAFLFDAISKGHLTPQQALDLRQHMSATCFEQGSIG